MTVGRLHDVIRRSEEREADAVWRKGNICVRAAAARAPARQSEEEVCRWMIEVSGATGRL